MSRVNVLPAVDLWGREADPRQALWTADELPAPTADHIDPTRRDDRAAYARARAAGVPWYCPRRCTHAHRDECDCPCEGACHMRHGCIGH